MTEGDDVKQTRRARRREERAASGQEAPAKADDVKEPRPEPSAKAAKKKKASSVEEIRDRNRRLREEAVVRRRSKRERERAASATGLDAGEMVDDALARSTHAVTQFLRRHFNVVQWLVLVAIVGGMAWLIYSWRSTKQVEKASDVLAAALEAEQGYVAGSKTLPAVEEGARELATYPSEAARLKAAEAAYRKVIEVREGSLTSLIARLGLAGILYDQGKYDAAIKEYEAVKQSKLTNEDRDARGRVAEGIGLALEAKGNFDGALKAFRGLANLEVPGFDTVSTYHQARVLYLKGEAEQAKKLLVDLQKKLEKQRSPGEPPSYLEEASRQLLYTIDPSQAPTSSVPGISPEELEQIKKQFVKNPKQLQDLLKNLGKVPGQIPAPPASAP